MRCIISVDPEVLQSGFGVIFQFGLANVRKIAGEFLSEFLQRSFFLVSSGVQAPQKKFMPKIHAQNRRHSSPICHS